jgi:type III pantothenate kinase
VTSDKRKTRAARTNQRLKLLLALDVGNTNTVLGVFDGRKLIADWRLTTARDQTVDEYGILTRDLFTLAGLSSSAIRGMIVASVVPGLNATLEQMAERYFGLQAVFVEAGTKTSIPVRYSNPKDVGADRIANAAAAFAKYGGPSVVVDFGTAINFDVVSQRGEYMGGVIAPGLGISADALFAQAARLFRVEIRDPHRVVGKNTAESMQAGFYYGFVGLVDGILERLKKELGAEARVIATGGQAALIAPGSRFIETVDEHLTLEGLRILWDKVHPSRDRKGADKPVTSEA